MFTPRNALQLFGAPAPPWPPPDRRRRVVRTRGAGEREQLSLEAYSNDAAACDMMPQRPVWDYSMSSGRVHYREGKAFMAWLARMRERIMDRGGCVSLTPPLPSRHPPPRRACDHSRAAPPREMCGGVSLAHVEPPYLPFPVYIPTASMLHPCLL
jgi:hypothetical protein